VAFGHRALEGAAQSFSLLHCWVDGNVLISWTIATGVIWLHKTKEAMMKQAGIWPWAMKRFAGWDQISADCHVQCRTRGAARSLTDLMRLFDTYALFLDLSALGFVQFVSFLLSFRDDSLSEDCLVARGRLLWVVSQVVVSVWQRLRCRIFSSFTDAYAEVAWPRG